MIRSSSVRKMAPLSITCILAIAWGLLTTNGFAADTEIKVIKPTYRGGPARQEVIVGRPIDIEVKSSLSRQARARVFAGSYESLKTSPNRKSPDDCWIYDSVLLDPDVQPEGTGTRILFRPLPETWLGVGPLKDLTSRSYVFVFESGDILPAGPIKIKSGAVRPYFAGGLEVVVKAEQVGPDTAGLAADIQDLWKERERLLTSSPAQPREGCAYVARVEEDGNLVLAFEDDCSESDSTRIAP